MQNRLSTGPQSLQHQAQQQQQFQQPPQTQPPQSAASPAAPGSDALAATQPPKKAGGAAAKKGGQKQAATKSPAQAQKGVKRSLPDDVTEIPVQKNALAANQRSVSQQGQAQPTLPQEADQRPQAMKNQQMGAAPNAGASEDAKRLMAILEAQERRVDQEQTVEVSFPPNQLAEYHRRIMSLAREIGRTGKVVSKWYGLQRDDERAAIYFYTVCSNHVSRLAALLTP